MLLLDGLHPETSFDDVAEFLIELLSACLGIVPAFLPSLFLGIPDAVAVFFDVDVVVVTDAPEDHDFDLDDALASLVIVPAFVRFGDFFEMTTDGDLSAASGDAIFASLGHW